MIGLDARLAGGCGCCAAIVMGSASAAAETYKSFMCLPEVWTNDMARVTDFRNT
jgi:hypothetical protein